MADFVETMRLKGMAEEDVYFAKRDRELIAALRQARQHAPTGTPGSGQPPPRQGWEAEEAEREGLAATATSPARVPSAKLFW